MGTSQFFFYISAYNSNSPFTPISNLYQLFLIYILSVAHDPKEF